MITLTVNGRTHALDVAPGVPLLTVLRNDLGLNGPKYGCGLGECGACSVLVGGVLARACTLPVGGVAGRAVTTLEGLGTRDALHPVQQAFIECQAAQCGYCLNGMIVATVALLARVPRPSDEQARAALAHQLCRCGAHLEILQAVQRAAQLMDAAAYRGIAQRATADRSDDRPELRPDAGQHDRSEALPSPPQAEPSAART
ncbi:MAG: (2Fe-2S)-binding protein [Ideonella sp.]|nr:(2Fe-2S)-binding protein [Ideonella sp.]MCC7456104.1 (2Fe-2S)-binding protein [Nitrospira sp.]